MKCYIPPEAQIESVARRMCLARGIDPDERVSGGVTSFGPHEFHGASAVPMVAVYAPLWKTFYYPAMDALIAARALAEEQQP